MARIRVALMMVREFRWRKWYLPWCIASQGCLEWDRQHNLWGGVVAERGSHVLFFLDGQAGGNRTRRSLFR